PPSHSNHLFCVSSDVCPCRADDALFICHVHLRDRSQFSKSAHHFPLSATHMSVASGTTLDVHNVALQRCGDVSGFVWVHAGATITVARAIRSINEHWLRANAELARMRPRGLIDCGHLGLLWDHHLRMSGVFARWLQAPSQLPVIRCVMNRFVLTEHCSP